MICNPAQIIRNFLFPKEGATKLQQNGIDCSVRENLIVPAKSFVNILLNEEVDIPLHMCMTLIQRSSLSRAGIFITSGLYDSGFKGAVGCSIYNMSDKDVYFFKNDRICQAVFHQAQAASAYDGQYQGMK